MWIRFFLTCHDDNWNLICINYDSFQPSHRPFVRIVLVFFISMLISTASLFPNELSFISYLDIANPKFTDNPASIALMSGFNINYDTPLAYSSKDASRHETYYGDLYDGIYDVKFEKENTIMLSGKLALNNFGISFKKHISKFHT